MAIQELDIISNAIVETEREIAGEAWGEEDTEILDSTGDRSLESLGEGLEGQHEAGEEDADDDESDETEGDDEVVAADAGKTADGTTGEEPAKPNAGKPDGQIPSGRYREVAERARTAEAERDALKAQIEKSSGDNRSLSDRLDLVMREIATLRQAPRTETKVEPVAAVKAPDMFEDPEGFANSIRQEIKNGISTVSSELRNQAVATSFELAHIKHSEAFPRAMEAIGKLNPQDPDARAVVQRIYASPNPGEALVSWHKRNETFARVGDDPAKFEERIREETRQALLKDPEFRKQLVAELRGEAANGDDGRPRTTTRLPPSLSNRGGSNLGAERLDPRSNDDSDQAVADSAWR
jgi:hypothetical protein